MKRSSPGAIAVPAGACRRLAWICTLAIFLFNLVSCGALSDSAPTVPAIKHCPTIDDQLAPLESLAQAGQLNHIAAIIRDDVDRPSQRALVHLVLELGAALPVDTVKDLPKIANDPRTIALIPLVVALLRPLPGNPAALPPIAAKTQELSAVASVASACLQSDLFSALAGLLREPDLPLAFQQFLDAGPALVPQLQQLLGALGQSGRSGFSIIAHNALTSLAEPGLDLQPLLLSLSGVVDIAPALLQPLYTVLQRFSRNYAGEPTPQRTAALQGLVRCVLQHDPDNLLPGLVYDALEDPTALPLMPTPAAGAVSPVPVITQLLAIASDVFSKDAAARDAASQLLGLILQPERAIAAVPELILLLQSDALLRTLALLGELVDPTCGAPLSATETAP